MASRKKDRKPRRLFKERPTYTSPEALGFPSALVGGFKMSDALKVLVEPFRDRENETEDSYRLLLHFGSVAWNVAILPDKKGATLIEDTIDAASPNVTDDEIQLARDLLRDLVERKLELFPTVMRMMISFEIINTGDSYHLNVASTL